MEPRRASSPRVVHGPAASAACALFVCIVENMLPATLPEACFRLCLAGLPFRPLHDGVRLPEGVAVFYIVCLSAFHVGFGGIRLPDCSPRRASASWKGGQPAHSREAAKV
jgi:hypothetical protein